MKVYTWVTTAPETPEAFQAVARIMMPMATKGGKMADQWHPVIFTGRDEETVRSTAQAWYDAEIAKERAKLEGRERQASAMKASREARKMGAPVSQKDAGIEAETVEDADFIL